MTHGAFHVSDAGRFRHRQSDDHAPTIGALRPQPAARSSSPPLASLPGQHSSTFWFLFPSGHFVPRVDTPGCAGLAAALHSWNYGVGTRFDIMNWPEAIFYPLILVMWATWPVSQVIRYRRVSTGIERQQTKWVVYALAMVAVAWPPSTQSEPLSIQPAAVHDGGRQRAGDRMVDGCILRLADSDASPVPAGAGGLLPSPFCATGCTTSIW